MIIVFDFDGTLADSLSVMLDIYNKDFVPKWNLRPVAPEDWQVLRQMSITKGVRYVGAKPYQLAKMLGEGRRIIKSRAGDIKLFPGAADLIKHLKAQGHDLYILSTNDQAVVQEVLKAGGITKEITVLKSPKLFGKAASLRRLLHQTGVSPGQAWMIGDELRDMSAAKRAGMQSMAVIWGFQPEATLAAHKPTAIARSLEDISKLLAE